MSLYCKRPVSIAVALSLGLSLAACGGGSPMNRTLYSVKQPVVERSKFALDVRSGSGGLAIPEQRRVDQWFESLSLGYGDKVYIDDANLSPETRDAVSKIAGRRGVLLSEGTPVTNGYVEPGMTRIVVTRSTASVPGCPDWSDSFNGNYGNATTADYGCAVNGNLAAMVADPEHLLKGAEGSGETVVMSSTKAIDSYRERAPSGEGELAETASSGGN